MFARTAQSRMKARGLGGMPDWAGDGRTMVDFTADFRERMWRKLARYVEAETRRSTAAVSVSVEKFDDQKSVASVPGTAYSWPSEESGPSPLAYFLSSLALCQCVHYAEHAAAKGLRLDALRIDVRGRFQMAHPRQCEAIDYAVVVDSPEPKEIVERLARTVAADCYVTGTLKRACEVRGSLVLNGTPLGVFD